MMTKATANLQLGLMVGKIVIDEVEIAYDIK